MQDLLDSALARIGAAQTDDELEAVRVEVLGRKGVLAQLAARLDHKDVNTVPPFDLLSPSTEHLAAWFFAELHVRLPQAPLVEVEVWEGPDCSAAYRP